MNEEKKPLPYQHRDMSIPKTKVELHHGEKPKPKKPKKPKGKK